MRAFIRQLKPAIISVIVFTVLLGVVYPLVATAIGQVAFNDEANGSLIRRDGVVVGSELIGQTFTAPEYFHSRHMRDDVGLERDHAHRVAAGIGVHYDSLAAANARLQAARVAQARGLTLAVVMGLIDDHTDGRSLGVLGEPGVNVVLLNLALDEQG